MLPQTDKVDPALMKLHFDVIWGPVAVAETWGWDFRCIPAMTATA